VIDKAPDKLSSSEAELLLRLARATLNHIVAGGAMPSLDPNTLSSSLTEERACFATLRNHGELRGCVGSVVASKPLFEGVMESVRGAARRDSRFQPVTADELERIHIELSILTEPVPLNYDSPEALLELVQPHEHGVLLRIGARTATFLPKVWDDIPDKQEFLARLCAKAGFEPRAWRGKNAIVSVYGAEVIEESVHLPTTPMPSDSIKMFP
jgi:AmmeMemoRadiSam system protein A